MQLYLARHGIAEDLADAQTEGRDEGERRLTEKGRDRAKQVARSLYRRQNEMEVIVHSSYVRAIQTAEIFANYWPGASMVEKGGILPMDSPKKGASILESYYEKGTNSLILVGHEPNLSHLMGLLLTGKDTSFVVLKKSGIAQIEWHGVGRSMLLAFLPPKFIT